MYRVTEKNGKFYIQKKTIGLWISIEKPAWFNSNGAAQSYINTVLEK